MTTEGGRRRMPRLLCITHRGAFLVVFGVVYMLFAKSLFDDDRTPADAHLLRFALGIVPHPGWAIVWAVCGGVALIDGALTLTRKRRDAVGFAAAVTAPTVWSLVYFAAWIGDDRGTPNLWGASLVFGLIAAAVLLVAGMPNPGTLQQAIDTIEDRSA